MRANLYNKEGRLFRVEMVDDLAIFKGLTSIEEEPLPGCAGRLVWRRFAFVDFCESGEGEELCSNFLQVREEVVGRPL